MAVGILSIGMTLVATMFPLAMHLTAVAAERTIAAVVADQAFAKIQLYGVVDFTNTNWGSDPCENCVDFNDVVGSVPSTTIAAAEFAYPAMEPNSTSQYYWSALCRKANSVSSDRTVQVIVFVSRKRGAGLTYQGFDQPVPVLVDVTSNSSNKLNITNTGDEKLINSGSVIVDNTAGQMYRVIERSADDSTVVILDRNWDADTPAPDKVWVVAPPDSGGAEPVIAVFQKLIKF